MKLVVQRVKSANLSVDGRSVSEIGHGLAVYVGVEVGDVEESARYLASKVAKLRVFSDECGKMNRSVLDVSGEALVISQFTLLGDADHGNRPSYSRAENPSRANELYLLFSEELRALGVRGVKNGVFGADMHIVQENDGPVTILMERK